MSEALTAPTERKWPRRLSTQMASEYLTEVHGIPTTIRALQARRQRDDGPVYSHIGAFVYYLPADIDDWVEGRVTAGRQPRRGG